MFVGQKSRTSNATFNLGDGIHIRWRDVSKWLLSKMFNLLTFIQMMQNKTFISVCFCVSSSIKNPNYCNVKFLLKLKIRYYDWKLNPEPKILPPAMTISFETSSPTAQAILMLDSSGCFIGKPPASSKGCNVDRSVSITSSMSAEALATRPPNM